MKQFLVTAFCFLLSFTGVIAVILSTLPMIGWWGGVIGFFIYPVCFFQLKKARQYTKQQIKFLKGARLTSLVAALLGLVLHLSCAGYSEMRWTKFEKTLQGNPVK